MAFLKNKYEMDLTVITLADGMKHDYFSRIRWNNDSYSPLGTAELSIPLTSEMLSYWVNYYDIVVISAKLKNSKENTNSKEYYQKIISERTKNQSNKKQTKYNKKQKQQIMKIFKQRIVNDEYNFSFIGRAARTKTKGMETIIELEDIGWKFMEKMPEDFRKKYVSGQATDDVFQAMCEFMGIEFAYSLNTLNDYKFSNDGFSITKDNKTIEEVPNFLQNVTDETFMYIGDDSLSNLESKNKIKNKKNNQSQDPESLASSAVNSGDNNKTHMQDIRKKKEQYKVDFESRIKDLFIGNTYYESDLTNLNFKYDAITIEPASDSSSSQMQQINNPQSGGESEESGNDGNSGSNGGNN